VGLFTRGDPRSGVGLASCRLIDRFRQVTPRHEPTNEKELQAIRAQAGLKFDRRVS
jgi:hypothetical protein